MSLALVASLTVAPAANATQYSDNITSTTTLYSGDSLRSASGQFELVMQGDGNLVLYSYANQSMWATFTSQPGSRVVLQSDGNLVVYNSSNQSLWQSGTSGSGAARLTLQDDGNLVLRTLGGSLLWASYSSLSQIVVGQELRTDYSLRSPNGNYKLVMQADGNLVLYNTTTNPWQAIWWHHTNTANAYAVLQGDGNFVVYKGTGGSSFQTGTSGAMSRFAVENDGRLVLYRSDNSIAWQTSPGPIGTPSSCSNAACPRYGDWMAAKGPDQPAGGPWAYCWWSAVCGHNCTNYVAWRMAEDGVANWATPSTSAGGWRQSALNHGFTVNNTPSIGAIAFWPYNGSRGAAGHVAIVEAINGSSVTISQDSFNDGPYSYQTISVSAPAYYIHVPGWSG